MQHSLYRTFVTSATFQYHLSLIIFILTSITQSQNYSKPFQRLHLYLRLWGWLQASSLTGYANQFATHIILIRVYRQNKKPLWDNAYMWQGSLLSFTHLIWLLIWASHSITPNKTPSSEHKNEEMELELKLACQCRQEHAIIWEWLVFPPLLSLKFRSGPKHLLAI
jgi:hypothetical protein